MAVHENVQLRPTQQFDPRVPSALVNSAGVAETEKDAQTAAKKAKVPA
jgi:hypothetical protein